MKVRDVIFKMVDNYLKITVDVFDKDLIKKGEYVINPHELVLTDIPESVLDSKVGTMVLYFDSLSIFVFE